MSDEIIYLNAGIMLFGCVCSVVCMLTVRMAKQVIVTMVGYLSYIIRAVFVYLMVSGTCYFHSITLPWHLGRNILWLILSTAMVYAYWKRHQRTEYDYITRFFCMILIPQAVGLNLYVLQPDIYWFELSLTISMLLLTAFLFRWTFQTNYNNQKRLVETEYALQYELLRPHFLYNALSSISTLCEFDGELAAEMTHHFSDYLTKNLEDISEGKVVPFSRELSHLENYIAIERMRFQDALNVKYEIETDDFYVPSMVLQPLVENAIKHGIGVREEGGTITISTKQYEKSGVYVIVVHDDGVGFDVNKEMDHSRSHIGLMNIRKRLSVMESANLVVNSEVGRGTTITVMIPKNMTVQKV